MSKGGFRVWNSDMQKVVLADLLDLEPEVQKHAHEQKRDGAIER